MARTDSDGYAYKGSQRQLQDFVNCSAAELNRGILGAVASLPRSSDLRWVSPLKDDRYREYSDSEFLAAVGQTSASPELRQFWPPGGPSWDALAIVNSAGRPGVLLVEAKAHVNEIESSCAAKDKVSIRRIRASLDATKAWLGADKRSDWLKPYLSIS